MDFWDNFCAHNKGLKVFLPYKKIQVNWTSGVQVMAIQRGSNWSFGLDID